MRAPHLVLLTLLLAGPAGAEEIDRTSRPVKPATEAREGWREPGFRLELQLGAQFLDGTETGGALDTPEGIGVSLGIEPGLRLSSTTAISAGLRYALVPERRLVGRGYSGLVPAGWSWNLTGDFTWFPAGPLFLGAGIGYAGVRAGCHATGAVVLVRAGAQLVAGESMAMGPLVQVAGSLLTCDKDDLDVLPTGRGPEPRRPPPGRTWLHDAVFLAWSLAWR